MIHLWNVIRLNNDAAECIRSGQYHRATLLLDWALIQLARPSRITTSITTTRPSSIESQQQQHDEQGVGTIIEKQQRQRSGIHLDKADDGIDTFTEPVELICAHQLPDESTSRLFIFYNLGIAHSRLGNDEDALGYFSKAKTQNEVMKSLSQFKNSSQEDSFHEESSTLALLHNLGRLSFRSNCYDEAIEFYNSALQLTQQCPSNKYHFHGALTLNCLGVVRLASKSRNSTTSQEETEAIKSLFLEALSLLETVSPNETSTTEEILSFQATVFCNLGRVNLSQNEYDKAKKMFQSSYYIRKKLYEKDLHCDVVAVLFYAGEAEYGLGNLDEALRLYSKFVDTSLMNPNTEQRQDVALAFKRMGQLYHHRDEKCQAIDMYVQALKVYKLVLVGEKKIREMTSILIEIGAICLEQNDLLKARCVYQEVLRLLCQMDSNHPQIPITLINIANIFQQQNECDEALEHYHQALKVMRIRCREEETDKKLLHMACILSCIGLIHDKKCEYWEATAAFEEALEIRVKVQGKNHFDISSTLNALGLIYFKQGLLDLAVCNFKDSLDIRLKQKNANSSDISVALFNIAAVYLELGEVDMATHYYKQTLHYESDSSSDYDADKFTTLKCLGEIHQNQGDLDEALVYYNEAVAVLLQMLDNVPNTEVANLVSSIGSIHLQKGEMEKAMEAYVYALRINTSEGVNDLSNIETDGLNIYDLMKKSCQSAAAA